MTDGLQTAVQWLLENTIPEGSDQAPIVELFEGIVREFAEVLDDMEEAGRNAARAQLRVLARVR